MSKFVTRTVKLPLLQGASPSLRILAALSQNNDHSARIGTAYQAITAKESSSIDIRITVTVDEDLLELNDRIGFSKSVLEWFKVNSKKLNLDTITVPISLSPTILSIKVHSASLPFLISQSTKIASNGAPATLSLTFEFSSNTELTSIDLITQIISDPIHFSINSILIPSLNAVGDALSRKWPSIFNSVYHERIREDSKYHTMISNTLLSILGSSNHPAIITKAEFIKFQLRDHVNILTTDQPADSTASSIDPAAQDSDSKNLERVIETCIRAQFVPAVVKFGADKKTGSRGKGRATVERREMIFEEDDESIGRPGEVVELVEESEEKIQDGEMMLELEGAAEEMPESDLESQFLYNGFQSQHSSMELSQVQSIDLEMEAEMLSM